MVEICRDMQDVCDSVCVCDCVSVIDFLFRFYHTCRL